MHLLLGHEAYLLNHQDFINGIGSPAKSDIGQLFQAKYLPLELMTGFLIAASFLGVAIFLLKPTGQRLKKTLEKRASVLQPFLRVTVGLSFIFAALSNTAFGPEMSLNGSPIFIRLILLLAGIGLSLGFLTQISAWLGLIVYLYLSFSWHSYMATYLSYLGILLALMVYGGGQLSLDRKFFKGKPAWDKNFIEFGLPFIRVAFGLALIYTGVTVKLLHPSLTTEIYTSWKLDQVFHFEPLFFAAAAGFTELAIGTMVLLGLVVRWAALILIVMMTLAMFYFHELIWPHLILYALSLTFLLAPDDLISLDRWLLPRLARRLGII